MFAFSSIHFYHFQCPQYISQIAFWILKSIYPCFKISEFMLGSKITFSSNVVLVGNEGDGEI